MDFSTFLSSFFDSGPVLSTLSTRHAFWHHNNDNSDGGNHHKHIPWWAIVLLVILGLMIVAFFWSLLYFCFVELVRRPRAGQEPRLGHAVVKALGVATFVLPVIKLVKCCCPGSRNKKPRTIAAEETGLPMMHHRYEPVHPVMSHQ